MRKHSASVAALALGLWFANSANAAPLTFEDGSSWVVIQDGYEGLVWEQDSGNFNFGTHFGFDTKFAYLNSGDSGDSTPRAGFIGAPNGKVISLNGGLFSANWATGLDLTLTAFSDGAQNGSVFIEDLRYRSPRSETFNLSGDRIEFAVSGPINAQGSPFADWQQYAFGMDNLDVEIASAETGGSAAIPVPATLGLLGMGLVGLGFVARRRSRM